MTDARVIVRGVRKVASLAPRPPLPRSARQHVGPRPGNPYWQERGWTQLRTGPFIGYYQAGHQRFEGRINPGAREFLIRRPPKALERHPHWICFRYQEDGWYLVHFALRPRDMSSGIMEIERILNEALGTTTPNASRPIASQRRTADVIRSRGRREDHDETRTADNVRWRWIYAILLILLAFLAFLV